MKKIILAYSGGLDTSCAVRWLKDKGYEVVCFMADLGQGLGEGEDFTSIKQRAMAAGAAKVYIKDLKDEFVTDFITPALKPNAVYEGKYLLATALGRPLIAKHLVELAQKEKACAVAHGCTGKGNDRVRFEVGVHALAPQLKVLAPAREWGMTRVETIAYAKKHGIPVPITFNRPFSIDECLWGRAIEASVLEDPWAEPPEEASDHRQRIP